MQKAVPSPAPPLVWVPPPPVLPTPAPPELLPPPEWDPLAADPVPPLPPPPEFPLLPELPLLPEFPVLPVLPEDPLPVDELVLDPEEDVELLAGSVELDDVDVDEVACETVAAAFP